MQSHIEIKNLSFDQKKKFKIAIVSSTWHNDIVHQLVEGAKRQCVELGIEENNIQYFTVAGAYELPQMIEKLARTKKFHALIPVGCVIRGETNHYELIVQSISVAFDQIGRNYQIPVSFGVLTVENPSQAYERVGGAKGNKGAEAAIAAVNLAVEFEKGRLMSSSRTKAREQILQLLYLMEQSKMNATDAIAFFSKNFEVHEQEMPFIRSRLEGIEGRFDEIDKKIAKYSEHWKMNRMPKVDRNILRLGAYELEFCLDVPVSVVINEAIELGKKFGDMNTSKFVNGILDKIAKEIGRNAA